MNAADATPRRSAATPSLAPRLSVAALCAAVAWSILACAPAPEAPAAPLEAPTATAEPAPPTAEVDPAPARPLPDAEGRAKLVSWWLRHDQSYMIIIDGVREDGGLDAQYLNPQPVFVSKAETWMEDGYVRLLLQLSDRNYPGNYYELAYDSGRDLLIGVYHHLGNDETFEVYFTRFEDDE